MNCVNINFMLDFCYKTHGYPGCHITAIMQGWGSCNPGSTPGTPGNS